VDEARTRKQIEDHAAAVEAGDMDTVIGDFSEELRPQAPEIAKTLPQPVTKAEVLSIEIDGDAAVAQIRYSNDDAAQTIQTRWQEQDGQPVIVHGEPIG
jgi:hypothetical protein